jgi:hypothetical protein
MSWSRASSMQGNYDRQHMKAPAALPHRTCSRQRVRHTTHIGCHFPSRCRAARRAMRPGRPLARPRKTHPRPLLSRRTTSVCAGRQAAGEHMTPRPMSAPSRTRMRLHWLGWRPRKQRRGAPARPRLEGLPRAWGDQQSRTLMTTLQGRRSHEARPQGSAGGSMRGQRWPLPHPGRMTALLEGAARALRMTAGQPGRTLPQAVTIILRMLR